MRLQTRCFASSVAAHALLAALLVFAPGFHSRPTDPLGNGRPLELLPGELIDAALAPGPPPGEPAAAAPPAAPPETRREVAPAPPSEPPPEPAPKPAPRVPPAEVRFDIPNSPGPGFNLPSSQAAPKAQSRKPPRETPKFDLSDSKAVKSSPKPDPRLAEDRRREAAASEGRARMENLARSLANASGTLGRAGGSGTIRVEVKGGGGGRREGVVAVAAARATPGWSATP